MALWRFGAHMVRVTRALCAVLSGVVRRHVREQLAAAK